MIKDSQPTDKIIELLSSAIIANTSLVSIEVDSCRLRNNQLVVLCKAIVQHQQWVEQRLTSMGNQDIENIEEFSLNKLRINLQGAQAIGSMLKEYSSLKRLNLVDAGLDDESLGEICQGIADTIGLEYLSLKQNNFETEGLSLMM